jgi:hypothetical protein
MMNTTRMWQSLLLGVVGTIWLGACAERGVYLSTGTAEPIGPELVRAVPPLRDQRFSALLDFETDSDTVFVSTDQVGRTVWDRSHTGKRSLRIEPGTRRVSIKLANLIGNRDFPGEWTLLGAFLYCEQPLTVTLSGEGISTFNIPTRQVALTERRWTGALADISAGSTHRGAPPNGRVPAGAMLVLTFPPDAPAVWLDDVLLIDNTRALVSPTPSRVMRDVGPDDADATSAGQTIPQAMMTAPAEIESTWSVSKVGLSYVGDAPGRFNFKLLTNESTEAGWTLDEANEIRARFSAPAGKVRNLTVYSDGRAYWDGVLKPMSSGVRREPAFAECHESPAQIQVPEDLGRVSRDGQGDSDNDGYNEHRGAYLVVARGPRLDVTLLPRSTAVVRPVVEIAGLPPGRALITMEGRLIDRAIRIDNDVLLIEIPHRIERPTTLNVRLQ